MRPILPNTSVDEVQAFRNQVEPIDMIGCTDMVVIRAKVEELAETAPKDAGTAFIPPANLEGKGVVERVIAEGTDPNRIKLDKAGYFVINIEDDVLLVEHYSYKERLIRVIEGTDARSIYLTLVRNGWISKLDHAAYIGKELTKAELSIKYGFEFVQDGG
jgi:tetrahydromethanopterin S-methyltransferase subunit A